MRIFLSFSSLNKKFFTFIALAVVVIAVPTTVLVAQQQQTIRQRASEYETAPALTAISLNLLSPSGPNTWTIGSAQKIIWNSSNIPSNVVLNLLLMKVNGTKQYSFPLGTNDGLEKFIVPTSIPSDTYQLSVIADKYIQTSEKVLITIANPPPTNSTPKNPIIIHSPNGGEKWEVRKTYIITWGSLENIKSVDIYLTRFDSVKKTTWLVASNISNIGKYAYTPSKTVISSKYNNYKISVYNHNNIEVADFSDNYFNISIASTIAPTLTSK